MTKYVHEKKKQNDSKTTVFKTILYAFNIIKQFIKKDPRIYYSLCYVRNSMKACCVFVAFKSYLIWKYHALEISIAGLERFVLHCIKPKLKNIQCIIIRRVTKYKIIPRVPRVPFRDVATLTAFFVHSRSSELLDKKSLSLLNSISQQIVKSDFF